MWLERISGETAELITRDDAKAHLRLLEDDFDAEVSAAIASAVAFLDVDDDGFGGLGFPLTRQVWAVKAPRFSDDVLRLPFGRVTSVEKVGFISPDGASETVSSSDYRLTRQGRASVVALLSGKSWPAVADAPDAVSIQFAAGFANAAAVPADIKAALRLLIGHFFENRLAVVMSGVPQDLKIGVDALTARYRRFAA